MSRAHFRFAPDILRRLGEELNPSPDQGIIEIVKNAYDADALHCQVTLVDTDRPGGTVRIVDDGDGMSEREVLDGWLVLGSSQKSRRRVSRLRRVPVGSKGLGRLAALRLGQRASLRTRSATSPLVESFLSIDWSLYDRVKTVDEVTLTIERRRTGGHSQSGTEIEIEKLHSSIGRNDVKRLARSLVLLADPFGVSTGFNPVLHAPEFADLERLVKNRYFQDADFHLRATLSRNGRAAAQVLDHHGKPLFKASHRDIAQRRDGKPYQCPAATLDFWVFLLTSASFQLRSSSLGEVREWLTAFGGVHVYQDGIRVAPYGNPGNDWLDLNLKRSRSPEERPSTNTSIGRIAIAGDDTLIQKTDRTGFIESATFGDLRAFADDAIEWLARRRLHLAEKRRANERKSAPGKVDRAKERVGEALEGAPPGARKKIKAAFNAYDRTRERETAALRREVQLYRTLSTAGITAATFAHESSGNPLKVATLSLNTLVRRARTQLGARYDDTLAPPAAAIRKALEALGVLGSVTLSLVDHDKRRLGRVDLHGTIAEVLHTFAPFLGGRDVEVELQLASSKPYLRASQAAIEAIITNLLNNSLVAFETASVPTRRILIRTIIGDGNVVLDLLDNGPGIRGIALADIWLPGETTRPNGTGLGLTIVRDTVDDLGGRVSADAHSELGGARISVMLPILGD